jgi:enoyl-CoA hydratase/carnithine racemase
MTTGLIFQKLSPHIGELTLSQPARRNALNAQMWADMPGVLKTAEQSGIRVLVITGAGGHFASGADISEFETLYATPESAETISLSIAAAFEALANFPLPTIAKIRGACVGGGCGLALCCDLRFADMTSKFAVTPTKLGLVYPFSDVQRLIAAVGSAHARDILFSARVIKAKQARKMGLINNICKVDKLDNFVTDYAAGLSRLSPQSLKVTKQMFAAHGAGQAGETPESQAWFLKGFSSKDFQEGYRAFLEKRAPVFD